VRPLLEFLEDRLTPTAYTWTGAGAASTWTDERNWGYPLNSGRYPRNPSDWANLAANTNIGSMAIPAAVSTLTGLAIPPNVTGSLVLQGPLTLTGWFDMSSASIIASNANPTLTLQVCNGQGGFNLWDGGTIGTAGGNGTLRLTQGAALTVRNLNDNPVNLNWEIQDGWTDSSACSLSFQGATVNLPAAPVTVWVAIGPSSSMTMTDLGGNCVPSRLVGANSGYGWNQGVMTAQMSSPSGAAVFNETLSMPIQVDGGTLNVNNFTTLTVPSGAGSVAAVEVTRSNPLRPFGRLNLGLATPGTSTGDGGATLVATGANGVHIGSGCSMTVYGQDKLTLDNNVGLSVDGFLTLNKATSGAWEQSNLEVTQGFVQFWGDSSFVLYGQYDETLGGGNAFYDRLIVDNGWVGVTAGATAAPQWAGSNQTKWTFQGTFPKYTANCNFSAAIQMSMNPPDGSFGGFSVAQTMPDPGVWGAGARWDEVDWRDLHTIDFTWTTT
jgi:hypothetical protein